MLKGKSKGMEKYGKDERNGKKNMLVVVWNLKKNGQNSCLLFLENAWPPQKKTKKEHGTFYRRILI